MMGLTAKGQGRIRRRVPQGEGFMQLGDISDVGVVGAGTMGAGIAQVFAQNGYTVRWYNRSAAGLQRGLERIRGNQGLLIRQGILTH